MPFKVPFAMKSSMSFGVGFLRKSQDANSISIFSWSAPPSPFLATTLNPIPWGGGNKNSI